MTSSFNQFCEEYRERIDLHLNTRFEQINSQHRRLTEAMHYSVFNGGKRVRPLLTYASALAIAEPNQLTDTAAAAIECIHAYSLIHDDLPAMDDDDLRRGQPTCHIAFDEATAILAGDALQALAYEWLCEETESQRFDTDNHSAEHSSNQQHPMTLRLHMLQILLKASGDQGMVAGQSIDLSSIDQQLTLSELTNMHQLKTGALINASVQLGGLSTGMASSQQLAGLTQYASAVGLAFQVQDDILDITADTQTLGKQQGADIAQNKPTFVSLLGLDGAKLRAKELYEEALTALSPFDYRADYLRHLAAYIVKRSH